MLGGGGLNIYVDRSYQIGVDGGPMKKNGEHCIFVHKIFEKWLKAEKPPL